MDIKTLRARQATLEKRYAECSSKEELAEVLKELEELQGLVSKEIDNIYLEG